MKLSPINCLIILFCTIVTSPVFSLKNSEKGRNVSDICSELGFTKILLVERHAIYSSHVYTYHEEDNKPGGGLYVYDLKSNSSKEVLDSQPSFSFAFVASPTRMSTSVGLK